MDSFIHLVTPVRSVFSLCAARCECLLCLNLILSGYRHLQKLKQKFTILVIYSKWKVLIVVVFHKFVTYCKFLCLRKEWTFLMPKSVSFSFDIVYHGGSIGLDGWCYLMVFYLCNEVNIMTQKYYEASFLAMPSNHMCLSNKKIHFMVRSQTFDLNFTITNYFSFLFLLISKNMNKRNSERLKMSICFRKFSIFDKIKWYI